MYLALTLGYASPTSMVEEMSMLDIGLWAEYQKQNSFGERRMDLRFAAQTASLVNCHIPKGHERAKLEDFLFKDGLTMIAAAERKPQTAEEQRAVFEALFPSSAASAERESRATPAES